MIIEIFQHGFAGTGTGSDIVSVDPFQAAGIQAADLRKEVFPFFPMDITQTPILQRTLSEPVETDISVTLLRHEIRFFESTLDPAVEFVGTFHIDQSKIFRSADGDLPAAAAAMTAFVHFAMEMRIVGRHMP
jgi:hypothetical protein